MAAPPWQERGQRCCSRRKLRRLEIYSFAASSASPLPPRGLPLWEGQDMHGALTGPTGPTGPATGVFSLIGPTGPTGPAETVVIVLTSSTGPPGPIEIG